MLLPLLTTIGMFGAAPSVVGAVLFQLDARQTTFQLDARQTTFVMELLMAAFQLSERLTTFVVPAVGETVVPFALTKQPSEEFPVTIDFVNRIPVGSTLSTGTVFASRKVTGQSTTLSSGASAGASTVLTVADPGVGARLTINAAGNTAEIVKVSAVTGAGPYTCTITPVLGFAHNSAETVDYEPGVSAALLASATATIASPNASFELQRGVHGQPYRVSVIVNTATGYSLEAEIDLTVTDT